MLNKKLTFIILALLIFLNTLTWLIVLNEQKFLEVIFFDIGQGDAIFIKDTEGHQILIDGGPNSNILEKLNQEMPFWDRSIDLIISTHPEKDHFTGLIEVLKNYKIENILWTGIIRDSSQYKEWKKLIENENASIRIAKAGQKIKITENIYLDILYPFKNISGQKIKDSNNTSIVSRLVFLDKSFLFTGDIYKSIENKLTNIDSDVLKVAHHGSKTSTSEKFIKEVSPQIAIIQVGKNNQYKHPHEETLANLNKFDIKVLRTDNNGDIKIISNGINLKYEFSNF